jgi:hypothetical protein
MREFPQMFHCATDLIKGRFVTITLATHTAAYATADAAAHGVTLSDGANGAVAVQLLTDTHQDFVFETEGTIVAGENVEVGTNGCGKVYANGAVVCTARSGGTAGSMVNGFNL